MYLFCDKIFPSTISSIAAGGIIGLYTTLIFVFSRFLRGTIFSGSSSKIMFDDLPYVDRVLQLCLDIYLVRESFEFTLEEDLFAKLIFLYRSPETVSCQDSIISRRALIKFFAIILDDQVDSAKEGEMRRRHRQGQHVV